MWLWVRHTETGKQTRPRLLERERGSGCVVWAAKQNRHLFDPSNGLPTAGPVRGRRRRRAAVRILIDLKLNE